MATKSWRLDDVPLALLRRDPVPPISTNPPRATSDAELGRLAMELLNVWGSALAIIPRDRPADARRLLRMMAELSARPPTLRRHRPLWDELAVLPDDQLRDVLERARIGAALLD